MKKFLLRAIPVLVILLIIGGICGYKYYFRILYNDSYVNGNTAGNLYNSGLFCESNGEVFFANPADNDTLYVMNSDGSNVKKLCDESIAYINADEHYVYYVRASSGANSEFAFLRMNTNSLCRLRRDGKGGSTILDDQPTLYASLSGNYIYYLHYDETDATTLYRIKLDGENKKKVNESPYFTCSTDGQYLHYNGINVDHNVYKFDTTTEIQSLLYEGNCWMPTVIGDTLYFMDCDANYKLAKVNLSTGEKIHLSEDRIDCYNVSGDYIYFQRNSIDEPAICRMRTDGSEYEVIRTGVYHEINVTSQYVYFTDYYTDMAFYTSTKGGGSVEVFAPEESE